MDLVAFGKLVHDNEPMGKLAPGFMEQGCFRVCNPSL
jgi:hypothetical protein